jgi:hypothetical protein
MQTFLPYPDFQQSVQSLDYRRLGKQRVEAKQILNALAGASKGWTNHPATNMWRGYESALRLYHNICIREWIARGYNNNMPLMNVQSRKLKMPPWLGDPAFHASHRSNLLRKDSQFYAQWGWSEPPNLPYIWPV